MVKPTFERAWGAFQKVNIPVSEVGKFVGGNVQKNIDAGFFKNACPIRISYVLNHTGFPIPRNTGYETVTGKDKRRYIFRVNDMMNHLSKIFGNPNRTTKSPKTSDFSGLRGLIIVKGYGWINATGHATLWNGTRCPDSCHLMSDPDNGAFTPETAALWVLP